MAPIWEFPLGLPSMPPPPRVDIFAVVGTVAFLGLNLSLWRDWSLAPGVPTSIRLSCSKWPRLRCPNMLFGLGGVAHQFQSMTERNFLRFSFCFVVKKKDVFSLDFASGQWVGALGDTHPQHGFGWAVSGFHVDPNPWKDFMSGSRFL